MLRMKSSYNVPQRNRWSTVKKKKKKKRCFSKDKNISKILLGLLVQDVVKFHKKNNATPFHRKEPEGSIPLRIIKCCQPLFSLSITDSLPGKRIRTGNTVPFRSPPSSRCYDIKFYWNSLYWNSLSLVLWTRERSYCLVLIKVRYKTGFLIVPS